MKRSFRFLIFAFLSAVCVSPAYGFDSDEDFGKWLAYYYRDPDPTLLIPSIDYYANSSLFKNENARIPVVYFYASLMKDDDRLLTELFDFLSENGTQRVRSVSLHIYRVVDNEASKQLLKRAKAEWKDPLLQMMMSRMEKTMPRDTGDILSGPVTCAADVDILWSMFLATGDDAPVRKIISVLHLVEDGRGMELVIGGAARWSLSSNARQHERVLEILKDEARKNSGMTKRILDQIIDNARAAREKTSVH